MRCVSGIRTYKIPGWAPRFSRAVQVSESGVRGPRDSWADGGGWETPGKTRAGATGLPSSDPGSRGVQPLPASGILFVEMIHIVLGPLNLIWRARWLFPAEWISPSRRRRPSEIQAWQLLPVLCLGKRTLNRDFPSSVLPRPSPESAQLESCGGRGRRRLRFRFPVGGSIVSDFVSPRHLWSLPAPPTE